MNKQELNSLIFEHFKNETVQVEFLIDFLKRLSDKNLKTKSDNSLQIDMVYDLPGTFGISSTECPPEFGITTKMNGTNIKQSLENGVDSISIQHDVTLSLDKAIEQFTNEDNRKTYTSFSENFSTIVKEQWAEAKNDITKKIKEDIIRREQEVAQADEILEKVNKLLVHGITAHYHEQIDTSPASYKNEAIDKYRIISLNSPITPVEKDNINEDRFYNKRYTIAQKIDEQYEDTCVVHSFLTHHKQGQITADGKEAVNITHIAQKFVQDNDMIIKFCDVANHIIYTELNSYDFGYQGKLDDKRQKVLRRFYEPK